MKENFIKFEQLGSYPDSDYISDDNIAITVDHLCTTVPILQHRHDYYELEYISGGEGVQIINDRAFIVRKGDIVFFRLTDIHTYYTVSGMEVINCCFRPSALPDIRLIDSDPQASLVLRLSPEAEEEFTHLLGMLRSEYKLRREHFAEAAQCYIKLLLIFLRRSGYLRQDGEERWNAFLIYLSKNFRTVTLSSAAEKMYVSKNYFCTLFRQRFGKTFLSYINEMRLSEAKRLLIETDMPISEVWDAVGFTQSKQFYALFNRNVGMTPLRYRQTGR